MQCCFPYRTLKYLLQYSVNTLLSNKYYCNMVFVDYILIGWEMFGSDTVILAIINTKKYQLLIDLYSDRWECKTYPIMPFMGIKMCTKMHKKRNLLPISEICNTSILYLYFISLAAYKKGIYQFTHINGWCY